MSDKDSIVGAFTGGMLFGMMILAIFLAIIEVTPADVRLKIQLDAIQHGVGEYYINEKNDKAFRWKPIPAPRPGMDTPL